MSKMKEKGEITVRFSPQELRSLRKTARALGYSSVEEYVRSLAISVLPESYQTSARNNLSLEPIYRTNLGSVYHADALDVLATLESNSVDLIMTSPPFALLKKKDYGNADANEYVRWFAPFAREFKRILKPTGSLVIDIGGSWQKGLPVKTIYQYELLVHLVKEMGFYLAQEFFWWNPARLATPAEWVTIRRIRVKDAVNTIWWLAKTPYPKASNKRVLQPYSKSQLKLFEKGYNAGPRPSGHKISSDAFRRNNGGAIPPNLLALANTESNTAYQRYCKENNLPQHPARFPVLIPAFFIQMLTDSLDLVLDPFAGSLTTGEAAERLGRRWICIEKERVYIEGGIGRFEHESARLNRNFPTGDSYNVAPPVLKPELDNEPLPEDGGQRRTRNVETRTS
ncbi:hypothetical protein Thermus77420_18160 [Thermus thalpophilus]